jgi:hypothetical protein
MKVSIVPVDGAVSVDGVGFGNLDLSSVSPSVHAVQWYDTYGVVEFKEFFLDGGVTKPQNQLIVSFSEYEPVLVLWQEAKDAEAAALILVAAAGQPESTGTQTL